MTEAQQSSYTSFDQSDPLSIFDYSGKLMGHSLHSYCGDSIIESRRKGKGGLGQMVEEFFFGYDVNSNREADFCKAGVELKCTPLIRNKDNKFLIKERLVCTMIDYFELVRTEFEDSHLLAKCRLMLLLFYHHQAGYSNYDFRFIFRMLWELPEKDLLQIKKDYETISQRVKRGEAHLLSEGDTLYLGACRKGQKGDKLQDQPYSDEKAKKRAFSLKPAYMRYVLSHVAESPDGSYTNYHNPEPPAYELVGKDELQNSSFEEIISNRFNQFIGMNYIEICTKLGITPYQSKSKYADVAGLIASEGKSKRIHNADEFLKSGISMKTVRLRTNGMPKEAMSFKNIDYSEIFNNDIWEESEAYEEFTNRFLFVILRPDGRKTITIHNNSTGKDVTEQAYVIDTVFFWTMPAQKLELAKNYWQHIRKNVLDNKIDLTYFWKISDNKGFHVRPKATAKVQLTENPNGGMAEKYCYWLNASFIKEIIDENISANRK